ncbi:DUF3054 domain-containing protein [Glutamicibacter sp.]|uniref:DUF3054 domain-containing protein n=1 Tax=Glutamicibacter sp. TaxID=1931995 RepID=UPI0028BD62DA|nr:DUF3054 domain-containing protein [Glutamicibacter sp.]
MVPNKRSWLLWAAVDILLIILFALLGRREHEHGLAIGGILWTALPFMIGYVIMLSVSRPWLTISNLWPTGVLVWVGTVALGVAARLLFGSTAAVSFIIVATVVLGVFLMGRRAITSLISKKSAQQKA